MAERSEHAPTLATRQLTLTVLTVAGLLAQILPLPWSVAGLLFLVPAGVLGIRLLLQVRRDNGGRALLVTTAIALTLACLATVASAARVAVYPAARALEQCLAEAITEQARTACEAEWLRRATR